MHDQLSKAVHRPPSDTILSGKCLEYCIIVRPIKYKYIIGIDNYLVVLAVLLCLKWK